MIIENSFDLWPVLIYAFILIIISAVASLFSPIGIFFIIFTIVRQFTKSKRLKTASLVLQIVLAGISIILGILIAILLLVKNLLYYYNYNLFFALAIIMGVGFAFLLQVAVIVWQSGVLKKK